MKILILSCTTGEGHNSCAHAVLEELQSRGLEAALADALEIADEASSHVISTSYDAIITKAPKAFGAMYKAAEVLNATGLTSPVYLVNAAHARRLAAFIEDNGFDTLICTHLFPLQALTFLRHKGEMPHGCYGVLTDYTCIPFWNETDVDAYFLPHESVREECIAAGMDADKLFVTGLPVSSRFISGLSKEEAREKLGIPAEKKVYLVMTGGVGCVHAQPLCEELLRLGGEDMAVYVLAGRNQELKDSLDTLFKDETRVTALPFTHEVNLYMKAADVLITKPGGITTTEAAAARIPLVHTNAIPGCETRNADLFSSLGMSCYAESNEEAARCAYELVTTPGRAQKMREAQCLHINPHGARNAVDLVLKLEACRRS